MKDTTLELLQRCHDMIHDLALKVEVQTGIHQPQAHVLIEELRKEISSIAREPVRYPSPENLSKPILPSEGEQTRLFRELERQWQDAFDEGIIVESWAQYQDFCNKFYIKQEGDTLMNDLNN